MTALTAIEFSVDDRRALWALTTRHLRSATWGAVLAVRSALRAQAPHIDVTTRGDAVCINDDGAHRAAEIDAIVDVVRAPSVMALHQLETRFGTDLLVALTTAKEAAIESGGRSARFVDGAVVDFSADVAEAAGARVRLTRPRKLRREERDELRAWLAAPRTALTVDGSRWRRTARLKDGAWFARAFSSAGGSGLIGFALGDATSKTTVMTRGLWVAEDSSRPRGLPIAAVWDDDDVVSSDVARARARIAVERAGQALHKQLAETLPTLPLARRRQVRSLLLRGSKLADAFADVALFDTEDAEFAVSFNDLRARDRIVVGADNADILVDGDARSFLHRALPLIVKDALPRPRRRLSFLLAQRFGRVSSS